VDEAIPTNHEDLTDIVLASPLTDIIDFVRLDINKSIEIFPFHVLVRLVDVIGKFMAGFDKLGVLAAPNLSRATFVGSCVLYEDNVLRNLTEQMPEVCISLALLPDAEQHPLKTERQEITTNVLLIGILDKPLGCIAAKGTDKTLLNVAMAFCVIRELTAQIQPLTILPVVTHKVEREATRHV
jgi:hypothetical protein